MFNTSTIPKSHDTHVYMVVLEQAENEAAMQQIKKLKLDHAHTQKRFAEESARLQCGIAQHQVPDVEHHLIALHLMLQVVACCRMLWQAHLSALSKQFLPPAHTWSRTVLSLAHA